jgi:hypothetical protein
MMCLTVLTVPLVLYFQNRDNNHRGESYASQNTPGARTSSVLPDLLTQTSSSSGAPGQRQDKSTEEVRTPFLKRFDRGNCNYNY